MPKLMICSTLTSLKLVTSKFKIVGNIQVPKTSNLKYKVVSSAYIIILNSLLALHKSLICAGFTARQYTCIQFIKMQFDKPLPCRPPFNEVNDVSEKLHTPRGSKKTFGHKIVRIIVGYRAEGEAENTSIVYVSTQKRTIKLADCRDIKYINTILYNDLHQDQK